MRLLVAFAVFAATVGLMLYILTPALGDNRPILNLLANVYCEPGEQLLSAQKVGTIRDPGEDRDRTIYSADFRCFNPASRQTRDVTLIVVSFTFISFGLMMLVCVILFNWAGWNGPARMLNNMVMRQRF